MPPKRSESWQKAANQEGKVLLALEDIKKGQIKSLRAAAKLYEIPFSTLQERAAGVSSRVDIYHHRQKLTQLEEDSLTKWILSMDSRGAAPRPSTVREMANILLAARGETPPTTVGKNWPSTFIQRRDEIRTRFSRRYDYQRALNEDPRSIRAWFESVKRVVEENGILAEDIYNFDETGFAMGLISSQKVVTRAEYYGRRSILQPGNREWVTAIEAICADGYSLPPCVVFQGKVYIAGWFESNLPSDWRIEVSNNGWTTDEIGLRWLQKHFIPHTNSRVRGRYRLLILDGHGSHLTPQFDRVCAENDIIPLCMPPHSSHLLQPLDVACFAPLKRAYGRFVSDLARCGYNHIDKFDFLADYPRARAEAFKPQTIQTSFAATGITPFEPERVLSKLNISLNTPTPPGSRPSSRSSQFTPKTPRTVIQLQKQASSLRQLLKQRSNSPPTPSKIMLDQIIKGCTITMHNAVLLAQENADLRRANEKKRQKRTRSNRHIAHEGGLTIAEGLQLAQQPEQPVEEIQVVSHEAGESANQADLARKRAPARCSGCGELGHKINRCNKR
jgi:DDE superfamily endonuclease/Tc5 transposase-like DNA-binding protein/Psq-like protein